MFSKEGMIVYAQSVMDIKIWIGIKLDVVTYNSLVDSYCLHGEIDRAK